MINEESGQSGLLTYQRHEHIKTLSELANAGCEQGHLLRGPDLCKNKLAQSNSSRGKSSTRAERALTEGVVCPEWIR